MRVSEKVILRYLGTFGDRRPSELGYDKAYECPKCKGEGKLHHRTNDGRGEYDYECDLCEGAGYTLKEMKPKMVQAGWE